MHLLKISINWLLAFIADLVTMDITTYLYQNVTNYAAMRPGAVVALTSDYDGYHISSLIWFVQVIIHELCSRSEIFMLINRNTTLSLQARKTKALRIIDGDERSCFNLTTLSLWSLNSPIGVLNQPWIRLSLLSFVAVHEVSVKTGEQSLN